jgi:4-amino-4-deoxy-L-arabinose transferase-like glycosyltransferase
MNNTKSLLLFIFIAIIGFLLRSVALNWVPSGFFCDEASIGYNAYSILNTGKDEHGVSFPIFFQSFGDYRPPLVVYSTIPFVNLLGLNEVATRLPSALYGLITIIAMFFIGKEISPNKSSSFGLLTAFITSTMPWLIHYNRTGFEFTIYVTFFVITILLLLKTLRNKLFIMPAFIAAALTLYTYQPAKLLVPLLLLGFLFIYRKPYLSHKKDMISGLLVFFILSIPLILSFFNEQGLARFNMVSVFSAHLSFAESVLRIFHNYFIQMSPYYFMSGEPTFITRHFAGGLNLLLTTTLPFLLIGLIYTFSTIKNSKVSQLLIYWLLIYPVAGAVTANAPFTSRSIIGAPLFAILISLGIIKTIRYLPLKRVTSIIIALLMAGNIFFFLEFYFVKYPLYSSDFWGWQYGARDIVKYFISNEQKYDQMIMAPEFNAPEIFFKFYAPHNCSKCMVGTPDTNYNPSLKQLFAVTPYYLQSHPDLRFKASKLLYYPNKRIAFEIGEVVQ